MTDGDLYYVYQADGYNRHHPRIIRAASEDAAKDHHKQEWRDMFDKPAGAEPHDDTYAKPLDVEGLEPGDVIEL